MKTAAFIEKLGKTPLSRESKIWTDPSKSDFQESLARWTDVDKREAGAIIFPATESDIVAIIKLAIEASIPFVARAGGHSSWSTIGSSGFILDLSLIRSVVMNSKEQTATAGAGALTGDVVKAVNDKGYLAATGTVNSVGFIPSIIGGGITILAPLIGFGSDNIVSARMVTAKGELITISDDENAELLYAIKGAGQFFGIVTSLTIKVHPLSILGTLNATVWSARLVFDVSKAGEVAKAAIDIRPVVILAQGEIPFGMVNETFQAFEGKGGLKKWLAVGLTNANQFKPEDMTQLVEQRSRVTEKYPAAKLTGSVIEFTSDGPWGKVPAEKETAWSHRDIATWCHFLCWASDEDALDYAYEVAEEFKEHLRYNQEKGQYSIYGNFSRTAPVKERFKGRGRLEKLRHLKLRWDPEGIFTRELL